MNDGNAARALDWEPGAWGSVLALPLALWATLEVPSAVLLWSSLKYCALLIHLKSCLLPGYKCFHGCPLPSEESLTNTSAQGHPVFGLSFCASFTTAPSWPSSPATRNSLRSQMHRALFCFQGCLESSCLRLEHGPPPPHHRILQVPPRTFCQHCRCYGSLELSRVG